MNCMNINWWSCISNGRNCKVCSNYALGINCFDRHFEKKQFHNISTANDCIIYLQQTQCTSIDEIIQEILNAFKNSPPQEKDLRTISALYQEHENNGTMEEYAILTIWICCIQHITETETYSRKMHIMLKMMKKNLKQIQKKLLTNGKFLTQHEMKRSQSWS